MNFELTPQHKAVQQSARQFAQTVLQETVLEDDAAGRFPEEAYKKMGEMESEGLNPTVESAGNTAQILSAEEEKMESASLAEEPEWTEETEESKTAGMVTSETTTGTTITLYAIWEKTARLTPKRILERLK